MAERCIQPNASVLAIPPDLPHIHVANAYGIGWHGVMTDRQGSPLPDARALISQLTQTPHAAISYTRFDVGSLQLTFRNVQSLGHPFYTELTEKPYKGQVTEDWYGDQPNEPIHMMGYTIDGNPLAVFHAANAHLIDNRGHAFLGLAPKDKGTLVVTDPARHDREVADIHETVRPQITVVDSLGSIAIAADARPAACNTAPYGAEALTAEVAYYIPLATYGKMPGGLITPGTPFKTFYKSIPD